MVGMIMGYNHPGKMAYAKAIKIGNEGGSSCVWAVIDHHRIAGWRLDYRAIALAHVNTVNSKFLGKDRGCKQYDYN